MFEVKAHMIVREGGAKGAADSFFDPVAAALLGLAAMVRKHPFISLLILAAFALLLARLAYRAR